MDVKTTFLNGELEEFYMEQLDGFVVMDRKIKCSNYVNPCMS
jgi:hypothetical protein